MSFRTRQKAYEVDLHRTSLWAADAKLIVNEAGQSMEHPLPDLPTFRGHVRSADGSAVPPGSRGMVAATVLGGGRLRVHVFEGNEDLVVESAAQYDRTGHASLSPDHFIAYKTRLPEGALVDRPVHTHRAGHDASASTPHQERFEKQRVEVERPDRRRLSGTFLPTKTDGSYGRLTDCVSQPTLLESKLGVILDHGFVSVVSGDPAAPTQAEGLAALADVISSSNVIFNDQVGINLALGTTIVNVDSSGALGDTGPNFKPAVSGQRDSCVDGAGYVLTDAYEELNTFLQDGTAATVQVRGSPDKLLSRIDNWMGRSDSPTCPGCSHWHLFTDCFPAPGTVGLAGLGIGCQALTSKQMFVADTGVRCDDSTEYPDGCDVKFGDTANAASAYFYSNAPTCGEGIYVCSGVSGLSSYSEGMWYTFAHEVGHVFAAQHTFGQVSWLWLMSPNKPP